VDIGQFSMLIRALEAGKHIVGICRGLQGLHIAAGGKLVQDVTNHRQGDHHIIDTFTNEMYFTNSIHHQMVDLNSLVEDDYTLFAYASPSRSKHYLDGSGVCMGHHYIDKEPEVVFYNRLKAVGFQYHPEILHKGVTLDYSRKIVTELLDYGDQLCDIEHAREAAAVLRKKMKLLFDREIKSATSIVSMYKREEPKQLCLPALTSTKTKNEKDWRSNIKEF